MSKITAKNAVVLLGGYNLSTYLTTYEITEGAAPQEVTGFSDGCNNYTPGIFSASVTGNVLWDSTSDGAYAVARGYAGATSDVHLTILPEGGTAGNPSLSLPITEGGLTPSGTPAGTLNIGNLNFASMGTNEGVENGTLLHHGAVVDSTTDAGISDSVTGNLTCRCSATLHVWSACASDTYEVKVQHSDDDITYGDLLAFTLDGSAIGSERVSAVSGTLYQYRRVIATRTGAAGDSFGFSVHFWRDPVATT